MKNTFLLICIAALSVLGGYAQQSQFTPWQQFSLAPVPATIAQRVQQVLKLPADVDLELAHTRTSPLGTYVTFDQVFQGKKVYQGELKVFVNKEGKSPWMMNALNPSLPPAIEGADWTYNTSGLRMRLFKQFGTLDVEIVPAWLAEEQQLVPVYQAWTYNIDKGENWEVLLHAMTGAELQRTDRNVYHNHRTTGDTTGRARVWQPNPCSADGRAYGVVFSDNNDMHSAAFERIIDTVTLQGLRFDNGTFYLDGPHIRIEDFAQNTIAPVTSTTGDFFYTRDQSGWEDVMVYFHMDTYQRYIQGLGFTNLWGDRPLSVDPHGFGNQDNAAFLGRGDNSTIRFGEGGVDDAEDADVILHEYGHALSYAASPNSNAGDERRGFDEGFGDYIAASYTYDLLGGSTYGWGEIMNWDGHNTFWPGRFANNNDIYQPGTYSGFGFYTAGELWASAMMEIRQSVGATETDKLQIEALYGLTSQMSLEDVARLIIAADQQYNNGANEATIRVVFCNRYIFKGSDCLVSTNNGLSPEPANYTAGFDGDGNLQIRWNTLPDPSWQAEVVNMQGQQVAKTQTVYTDLSHLSPGMYWIKMSIKDKPVTGQKLMKVQ